jgi:hypothetical protein
MEIKGRLEQRMSEKFYLQRRKRKGHMGDTQQDPESGHPLSQLGLGFYIIFIASGRTMFQHKDFG